MSRVDITLNGRGYTLSCEDGQEPRLRQLVAYVDDRLRDIAHETPVGSEAQQLMLTALLLADEILDLRIELDAARTEAAQARDLPPAPLPVDDAIVASVNGLASRIEEIAERLERA